MKRQIGGPGVRADARQLAEFLKRVGHATAVGDNARHADHQGRTPAQPERAGEVEELPDALAGQILRGRITVAERAEDRRNL